MPGVFSALPANAEIAPMYKLIRPFLFLVEPELAHGIATGGLKFFCAIPGMKLLLKRLYFREGGGREVELMGIRFPNRVGLAAGFDKNASFIEELHCLGFGFVEIGTLTPLAQDGNPKPRLFRLPPDLALINRMGFNNRGLEAALGNLRKRRPGIIVGGNIGKNKATPNEVAVSDYRKCFDALYPWVDYFVVNVSSPNTPDLRALQEKEPLKNLLMELMALRQLQERVKPILLKIAPDLSPGQLDEIAEIARETGIEGIIATNTTVSREGLLTDASRIASIGVGGLSGAPLEKLSTEIISYLRERLPRPFVLIGVGGIMSAEDASRKIDAGADLVQVYTGFVYGGPSLIKRIANLLLT